MEVAKHPRSSQDQFIRGPVSDSSHLVLTVVVQFQSIQVNDFAKEGLTAPFLTHKNQWHYQKNQRVKLQLPSHLSHLKQSIESDDIPADRE